MPESLPHHRIIATIAIITKMSISCKLQRKIWSLHKTKLSAKGDWQNIETKFCRNKIDFYSKFPMQLVKINSAEFLPATLNILLVVCIIFKHLQLGDISQYSLFRSSYE